MGACKSTARQEHSSSSAAVEAEPSLHPVQQQAEPQSPRLCNSDIRRPPRRSSASELAHHTPAGQRRMSDAYMLADAEFLGEGSFGVVYMVERRDTNDKFAMKRIALDGECSSRDMKLRREIELQRTLVHPNICRIFESFEKQRRLYVVMELCTGGDLLTRLRECRYGFNERRSATLVEKMLSAVLYCHRNGVVHRDIKLDNFVFEDASDEAEIKLIDFGFATRVTPGREAMMERLGTPSYMAPELWPDSGYKYYTSAVDTWALGIVTYMMVCGKKPFYHKDPREKQRRIQHDPPSFGGAKWLVVSEECKDFLRRLLKKDPAERMSAAQALAHPWVRRKSTLKAGAPAAHELARRHEIIESVEEYCRTDDTFERLTLETVAFSTPPAKLEELRSVFVKMDVDDDGTISLAEFRDALHMRPEMSAAHVERMFRVMDTNESGDLDYLEFLSATISTQRAGKDRRSAKAAFSLLDRDGDGLIGESDLLAVTRGAYSSVEVQEMLDTHGRSGRISLDDFERLVAHVLGLGSLPPSPAESVRLSTASDATTLSTLSTLSDPETLPSPTRPMQPEPSPARPMQPSPSPARPMQPEPETVLPLGHLVLPPSPDKPPCRETTPSPEQLSLSSPKLPAPEQPPAPLTLLPPAPAELPPWPAAEGKSRLLPPAVA